MSEPKLTAQQFAEKYVKTNTKITQDGIETEGYILGYCKCGCEHIFIQTDTPGYQWYEPSAVFLTDSIHGRSWISVHVNELLIKELPPEFKSNIARLTEIVNDAYGKIHTKSALTKMLLEYDSILSKVEPHISQKMVQDRVDIVRARVGALSQAKEIQCSR